MPHSESSRIGFARANRQKPSGIVAKETILKVHLVPLLGTKRLGSIGDGGKSALNSLIPKKWWRRRESNPRPHTLAIGTELIIEGYRAKDGSNKGVGRNLLLADGRRVVLGGSANSVTDNTPGGK